MTVQTIEKREIVTEDMLSHLPEPVQRYMHYSGVIGQPWINTVHLKYRGEFRLGADKPWMPIKADQVYATNPPAFNWDAHLSMFGLPLMRGNDTYKDGKGHMYGKLAGFYTIFDERGPELLQGTMMRYLQEMTWFPIAYLSEYISWQAVSDHTADVTFTYGGESVTGRMYFDDNGRWLNFVAERYREDNGSYVMSTWTTPMVEYQRMAGLNLPVAGWGVWQLPDGDLPYVKIRLTDVQYNVPIREF